MTIRTRRTEIRIETHEITITRFRGKQFPMHCEQCDAIVEADRDAINVAASQVEGTEEPPEGGTQNIRRKK